MFLCDDEYEYLQSILMCGTGVIVTDSLTLSGMPVPGLEFGGSWEISPEDSSSGQGLLRLDFTWDITQYGFLPPSI